MSFSILVKNHMDDFSRIIKAHPSYERYHKVQNSPVQRQLERKKHEHECICKGQNEGRRKELQARNPRWGKPTRKGGLTLGNTI